MQVNILHIFLSLTVSLLIYRSIPTKNAKNAFLLLLSCIVAMSYDVAYAGYFLCNIVLVHLCARRIRAGGIAGPAAAKAIVAWLLINLIFFKYVKLLLGLLHDCGSPHTLQAAQSLEGMMFPVGISYIVFRLIHYVLEVSKGKAEPGTFMEFALYILFFPTFLAGPVERFQKFLPQARSADRIGLNDIQNGVYRITAGFTKKFLIADLLAAHLTPILDAPQAHARPAVLLAVYALSLRIYLDFSGYTDMALGVARLFGYRIVENFNRPLLQRNIALFWRNWHISVSTWIRDYFFLPVFGSSLFGRLGSDFRLYAGIFATMVVFNLWHGASVCFLLLGIYHGAGLACWQLFQEAKKGLRRSVDPGEARIAALASWFLTFNFVSFGFILFNSDIDRVMGILARLFLPH